MSANAADAHQMTFVMLGACKELNEGPEWDGHRFMAQDYLGGMYRVFIRGDMFLGDEEIANAFECVKSCFLHDSWLLKKDAVAAGGWAFAVSHCTFFEVH